MKKSYRIVITGPESTAKSTLSEQLAKYFDGIFYPEYARKYLEEKSSTYSYDDVVNIAKGQLQQYKYSEVNTSGFYFFDTWLIITKVWFEWIYKKYPDWLEAEIQNCSIDLYLLCKPDIPWKPDPLRENGGEQRIQLFNTYKEELIKRNENFIEIGGLGEDRIQNAVKAVKEYTFGY